MLYSDGVTEAMNARRDLFGLERLKQTIRDAFGRDAPAMVRAISAAIRAWSPIQHDDLTIVVIEHLAAPTATADHPAENVLREG